MLKRWVVFCCKCHPEVCIAGVNWTVGGCWMHTLEYQYSSQHCKAWCLDCMCVRVCVCVCVCVCTWLYASPYYVSASFMVASSPPDKFNLSADWLHEKFGCFTEWCLNTKVKGTRLYIANSLGYSLAIKYIGFVPQILQSYIMWHVHMNDPPSHPPPHGVNGLLEKWSLHIHLSGEDVCLLQGHRHGRHVLSTPTANDTTTLQVTTNLFNDNYIILAVYLTHLATIYYY